MRQEIFLKKIKLSCCPYGEAEKYRIARAGGGPEAHTAPTESRSGVNIAPAETDPGARTAPEVQVTPAVWLTDDEESLRKLRALDECAVYLLTDANRDGFCPAAQWCLETPAGAEWREVLEETLDDSAMSGGVEAADDCARAKEPRPGKLPEWIPMDFLWRVWLRGHDLPWQIAETPRLYLREMTEEDLDFLYRCQQDELSARFVAGPKGGRETELEKLRAYRQLIYGFYGFGLWIVCEKETGRPVGRAGLQLREEYEVPELGFEIEASCRGRGYAREALEAVLSYAKDELELEELRSVVDVENPVSQKLCESLGFAERERKSMDGREWIFYDRKL